VAAVDVLLPVRDGAATLGEALASIRAQTFRDFRCLVLDDGSSDDSAAVADAVARADARFELHRRPPRGLVETLNAGLALATAETVARLDADDAMMPERLERQLALLRASPGVDVVASRVEFFGERVSSDQRAYERWLNGVTTPENIARDLFVESPLPHPAVTMRVEPVRRAGGYRDGGRPEDYDLWLRLARAGSRFAKHPAVLTRIRDHPSRLTRTDPRYTPRALVDCKAEHLVAARGLADREVVVWGAGRDGVRAAKALRRRGARLRHLVDVNPAKLARRMLGVAVREPASLREEPRAFVVAAVGVRGARELIRAALGEMGYREPDEFVCFH
jgi:glycosyltransferase involved in cell wall biosynthesis